MKLYAVEARNRATEQARATYFWQTGLITLAFVAALQWLASWTPAG